MLHNKFIALNGTVKNGNKQVQQELFEKLGLSEGELSYKELEKLVHTLLEHKKKGFDYSMLTGLVRTYNNKENFLLYFARNIEELGTIVNVANRREAIPGIWEEHNKKKYLKLISYVSDLERTDRELLAKVFKELKGPHNEAIVRRRDLQVLYINDANPQYDDVNVESVVMAYQQQKQREQDLSYLFDMLSKRLDVQQRFDLLVADPKVKDIDLLSLGYEDVVAHFSASFNSQVATFLQVNTQFIQFVRNCLVKGVEPSRRGTKPIKYELYKTWSMLSKEQRERIIDLSYALERLLEHADAFYNISNAVPSVYAEYKKAKKL